MMWKLVCLMGPSVVVMDACQCHGGASKEGLCLAASKSARVEDDSAVVDLCVKARFGGLGLSLWNENCEVMLAQVEGVCACVCQCVCVYVCVCVCACVRVRVCMTHNQVGVQTLNSSHFQSNRLRLSCRDVTEDDTCHSKVCTYVPAAVACGLLVTSGCTSPLQPR